MQVYVGRGNRLALAHLQQGWKALGLSSRASGTSLELKRLPGEAVSDVNRR